MNQGKLCNTNIGSKQARELQVMHGNHMIKGRNNLKIWTYNSEKTHMNDHKLFCCIGVRRRCNNPIKLSCGVTKQMYHGDSSVAQKLTLP